MHDQTIEVVDLKNTVIEGSSRPDKNTGDMLNVCVMLMVWKGAAGIEILYFTLAYANLYYPARCFVKAQKNL